MKLVTLLSDDSRLLKTAAGKIYFPFLSHRQQFLSKTVPILVISIKRHERVFATCTSMYHTTALVFLLLHDR